MSDEAKMWKWVATAAFAIGMIIVLVMPMADRAALQSQYSAGYEDGQKSLKELCGIIRELVTENERLKRGQK